MALPKIMTGPKKGQDPQNKLKVAPYSGGKGYQTMPLRNLPVISDDGCKDLGC